MCCHIEDDRFTEGMKYASRIISSVRTFLDFSDAMLDYMGEDYLYSKSLYSALSNCPGLKSDFQPNSEWEGLSDEQIKEHYLNYKRHLEQQDREKEFKDNIDELQFLVKKYRSSDGFKKMLDFVGRFRHLAPYNAMLVEMQLPGATFVFNGKKWKEYNRQPKSSARQLITLIPFGPI